MSSGPQGRAELKALLERHGLHPKRRLGQHFLAEPNVVDRIVRVAGVGRGDRVVEIGAGTGTLTRALVAAGAHVVAYEIDRSLEPVLVEAAPGAELRFEDAAGVDLSRALDGRPWVMVANLPYNVGTGIVLDALQRAATIERFVVMVQREVAERLLAGPGSKAYGIPSVIVALHATGRVEFSVPPHLFVPPPAVESVVVSLDRVPAPDGAAAAVAVAARAFGQRRKMLRRSLDGLVDEATILGCGVDPTARAEDLATDAYLAIGRSIT